MLFYKKSQIVTSTITLVIASITLAYFYAKNTTPTHQQTHHLSIVAAHNQTIKDLVVPFLQKCYKKKFNTHLHVEWIKHGGQNTNLKVIDTIFKRNKETTCGYDIIWGGGEIIFNKLDKEKRLATLSLPEEIQQNIPSVLSKIKIRTNTWVATCLSSFGMMYNKAIFKKQALKPPTKWGRLANPDLFQKIVNIDPSQSSNIWTIYAMILQAYGWEKGWEVLIKMAGNSIVFLDKSSSATSNIIQGIGIVAPTNDFYAKATIHMHGEEKIGFIIPIEQTIINADPVAILKGAPNPKIAKFCIECLLSPDFQKLLMFKKNTEYGPKNATIGRIAINKKVYQIGKKSDIASAMNPFEANEYKPMQLDEQKVTKSYHIVSALFKAWCINPHKKLKQAWKLIIDHGCKPEDIRALAFPPLTEQETVTLAKKWQDPLYRQRCIIQWTNAATRRYQAIIDKYKK